MIMGVRYSNRSQHRAWLAGMQGGGRVDEVSALAAGMEGFVEEVAAEVALGREEVEGTEGAAVFYLLVEDCLVEGSKVGVYVELWCSGIIRV